VNPFLRRILIVLTVVILLTAAVATATASRLSVTDQQTRIVWRSLELSTSSIISMRCAVTLEGSFHGSTIAKTRDLLIGLITNAAVQNGQCTGGRATVLRETLPWHLTYNSFRGTLPRIESVTLNLIRAGFIIESGGVAICKAVTSVASPARGIANIGPSGRVEGLRADETAAIPLTNGPGGFSCGLGRGTFSGTGTVTLLGTSNSISVRLI
jgi:hypothetical protein